MSEERNEDSAAKRNEPQARDTQGRDLPDPGISARRTKRRLMMPPEVDHGARSEKPTTASEAVESDEQ